MQNPQISEILATDFDKDKFVLPLYLPIIESAIKRSNHILTVIYREKILSELEVFKKTIGYDSIKSEIESDIELIYKDPKKLDEKFGIERQTFPRNL